MYCVLRSLVLVLLALVGLGVLCAVCFVFHFFFCVYVLAFCSEDGPQYFYPPVEAI